MATGNELASLRRPRGQYTGHFTRLSKKLDVIKQSGCSREAKFIQIKNRLEIYETELRVIQNEIASIDEEAGERGLEIADEYKKLVLRVTNQLNHIRLTTTSQSTDDESAAGRETASLKLPENYFPGHNAKKPPSPLPQVPTDKVPTMANSQPPEYSSNTTISFQGSNNNLNINAIQTPSTEKIASTRTPISSRVTRNSLHDTCSSSPTRDLTTTKFASALSRPSYPRTQTTLKVTTFNEPLDLKKEKVSPGDKSIQKVIPPNLLQNVHDSDRSSQPR